MSLPRVGLVTCRAIPDLTPDDSLLPAELLRHGIEAVPVSWDDAGTRWEGFAGLLLRSCWDYHHRAPEFLSWLDRLEACGATVWNPIRLVRWNLHKTYLRDLAEAGIPVLPTEWLDRGSGVSLEVVLERNGWERAVVKPAVSANADGTWIVETPVTGASRARFEELLRRQDVLVQRFEPAVLADGEWSLVYIAGRFSHAVVKTPRAGDFRVQEEHGGSSVPRPAPPGLVAQGDRIVARIDAPWLYARVDGVEVSGTLALMELELVEPSLYLGASPDAPARLAAAVRAAVSD